MRKLDGSQENGFKLADFKARVLDKIAAVAGGIGWPITTAESPR